MYKYFSAEFLKTKSTFLRKIIFIVPLLSVFTGLLFSYFSGQINLCFPMIMNHWSSTWIIGLITIMVGLFYKLEMKSTKFHLVNSMPVNLTSVWLSKIALIAVLSFIATAFLGFLMVLISIIFKNQITINCTIALILSWFLTLWMIPILTVLVTKINYIVLFILNFFAGIIFGVMIAPEKYWIFSPWSYPTRVEAPLLGMNPNGILLNSGDPLLNKSVIPVAIILGSIILLISLLVSILILSRRKAK